ncbi:MAG: sel1 repeat family protein [Planctomycetaceae bacterium]|jgi:TPR repeat protein|nr:sel1 repeat family protein [Planctomycetaceae bacterium]
MNTIFSFVRSLFSNISKFFDSPARSDNFTSTNSISAMVRYLSISEHSSDVTGDKKIWDNLFKKAYLETEIVDDEIQYLLAHFLFRNGNLQEALRWFFKSAEQGNPEAQWRLGTCYERGEGVPANFAESIKWHRKAVENL